MTFLGVLWKQSGTRGNVPPLISCSWSLGNILVDGDINNVEGSSSFLGVCAVPDPTPGGGGVGADPEDGGGGAGAGGGGAAAAAAGAAAVEAAAAAAAALAAFSLIMGKCTTVCCPST